MGIEFGNTSTASPQYDYAENMPSKRDLEMKPKATEAESPKSDLTKAIESVLGKNGILQAPVDYSGEIKEISPKTSEAAMREAKGLKPQDESEVSIVMDSGLKATVDEDGVKFEQLNTGEGIVAAWYSKNIGELDFSKLQKSSIGPGEGGFAERLPDPEANVDFETQKATAALYDALKNMDKGDFSEAQLANADRVLDQLKPFISIPARSDSVGENYQLNNIQADKNGSVALEYRGDNKTKDVALNGDKISIEYYQQPKGHDAFGLHPAVIDTIKVELDLSKMDSWTAEQKQEAGDLKAAVENVDTNALTPAELKARDQLLAKLDDVPATLQSMQHDNGMQSVGGSAFKDYLDKVNPPKTVGVDGNGWVVNSPLRDYALSEDAIAVKPEGEY